MSTGVEPLWSNTDIGGKISLLMEKARNYKTVVMFFRGGVLEPAGTVEIKFRRKDLVKAMHRLDTKCQVITQALASAGNNWHVFSMILGVLINCSWVLGQLREFQHLHSILSRHTSSHHCKNCNYFIILFSCDFLFSELPVKERKTLERQQKEREEQLLPIYQQVIWQR